ncbi:hypothetical protein ASF96_02710 [Microbacterium sp. Leaf179]|nr:hypothetical protein ASF96_02710 [Microbacterium sp. Leaf179]
MVRSNAGHYPHLPDNGVNKFSEQPVVRGNQTLGIVKTEHDWSPDSLAELRRYSTQLLRTIRNSDCRQLVVETQHAALGHIAKDLLPDVDHIFAEL